MINSNIQPKWANDCEYADDIIYFIEKDTTPSQFDAECSKYKDYTIDMGDYENGDTALIQAILKENLVLIDHIINKFGQEILFVAGDGGGLPLHDTTHIKGENGTLTAKKFIEYGTPIGIEYFECEEKEKENLLTSAIDQKHIGITVLCLGAKMECPAWYLKDGMKEQTERVLNQAKKIIDFRNAQAILFNLGMKHANILLPENIDYILRINAELALLPKNMDILSIQDKLV